MKHIYCLRTDTFTADNGQAETAYGITVLKEEKSISNIFSDKSEAIDFINRCNAEKLEFIHLENVIEDMLSSK